MTEDDTFRILKRTPRHEIENLVHQAQFEDLISNINGEEGGKAIKILKAHGWTRQEYNSSRPSIPAHTIDKDLINIFNAWRRYV